MTSLLWGVELYWRRSWNRNEKEIQKSQSDSLRTVTGWMETLPLKKEEMYA
jgi:hypothetical protein